MSDPITKREFLDPTPGSLPRLVVKPCQDRVLIGRHHGCDAIFSDPTVSRRHAVISREDGDWVIRDLGSTNGTKVNGRLCGRDVLQQGDVVTLGGLRVIFTVRSPQNDERPGISGPFEE